MKNYKKAALYIRVSTDAQREEGYSIDAQREMLEGFCISRGIKNYDFYIDGGWSGANIDRPEIKRMMRDISAGKIETVVVYKLDRLSRSQKDTLYLIEDVLNPSGVSFVSLNENMDTSTPIGRAMLGIMSAFAQLERETIRERTRMGMKERVKNGLWRGGGKPPFGYDYDKASGKLIPNNDAETVKQVFRLYLLGHSTLSISNILGLKYERMAIQILRRITYTGDTVYNGEIINNTHEAIISREIFERVRQEIERRRTATSNKTKNLLAGLIYCGVCGSKMRYQKWSGGIYKIYCYSQDPSKSHLSGGKRCNNTKTDANELEREVISDLFSLTPEKPPDEKDDAGVLTALNASRASLQKKLSRLYSLYSDDGDEILLDSINEIKRKLADTEAMIENENDLESKRKEIDENYKKLGLTGAAWENMNFNEKRTTLRELIDRIVITYDNVDIYYSDKLKLRRDGSF